MRNKYGSYMPWLVIAFLCLGFFGPNYTQFQLSSLAPQLIESMSLTPGEFTNIFSSPMIPAIFLSLVAGLLADKFGSKRIIAIGFAVTAFGTCWRIWSGSYTNLFLSMMLTGVGICFLNANSAKIIGSWFAPEKVGSMMGIVMAASSLGMTIGTGTTAMLPDIRAAYIIAAMVSVVTFLLWVLFIRDSKTETNQTVSTHQIHMIDSLKIVIKNRNIWIVGISLMFFLGCNIILNSLLPTVLAQRGIGPITAGAYAAVVTMGSFVGSLFVPIAATKKGKTKLCMIFLSIIGATGAAFSWMAPVGIILGTCLFFTGFAMGGVLPILMSIPIKLPEIGSTYAGTAGGFTSTLQMLGAVIIPSYVAAPIAGEDMGILFMVGGVCMSLVLICSLILPSVSWK